MPCGRQSIFRIAASILKSSKNLALLPRGINPGLIDPGLINPGFSTPGFLDTGFLDTGFRVSGFVDPGRNVSKLQLKESTRGQDRNLVSRSGGADSGNGTADCRGVPARARVVRTGRPDSWIRPGEKVLRGTRGRAEHHA